MNTNISFQKLLNKVTSYESESDANWFLNMILASGSIQIASASIDLLEVIKVSSTDNTDVNARLLKVDSVGALQLASGGNKIGDVFVTNTPDVTNTPNRTSTITTGSILTTNIDCILANTSRAQWFIQNLGTNPLYVKEGTGVSSSSFNLILAGGAAQNDGTGGFVSDTVYNGLVSASGSGPRYVVTELSY